jgi:branched-chain amino acid transport system substrate-binding protein
VDIYSSLPLRGPSATDAIPLEKGIRLALEQAGDRAGAFSVRYTSLDDAAGPAGWDPSHTAADARQAAADPRTVFYIGEFDDDASELSMPILNEAGIPQVSPANTSWPTVARI